MNLVLHAKWVEASLQANMLTRDHEGIQLHWVAQDGSLDHKDRTRNAYLSYRRP
jgi:hypothetical protein